MDKFIKDNLNSVTLAMYNTFASFDMLNFQCGHYNIFNMAKSISLKVDEELSYCLSEDVTRLVLLQIPHLTECFSDYYDPVNWESEDVFIINCSGAICANVKCILENMIK